MVPLIQSGRDLAVEAKGDTGKTAAFILPLLPKLRRGKAGIKALVVTSSVEDSRKVQRELLRFCRPAGGRSISVFTLGVEEGDRGEHRGLARQPDVVIGTPSRIIDHIRRGNLDFAALQNVVIDHENPESGFVDDLRFVFSKLPQKKQTLLFTPAFGADTEDLTGLLRRPQLVPLAAWQEEAEQVRELFIEAPAADPPRGLAAVVLAEAAGALLVQAADRGAVQKIARDLEELGLRVRDVVQDREAEEHGGVWVGTFAASRQRNLRGLTCVIHTDLPPGPEAYRPQSLVLEKIITVGPAALLQRLQEKLNVKPEITPLPQDDQVLAGAIGEILRRIRAEEDSGELARYRRLLRKNAPLSLRSTVAAYLLKKVYGMAGEKPPLGLKPPAGRRPALGGKPPQARPAVPAGGRPARSPRGAPRAPAAAAPERETPSGRYARLFISVGRNRGVHPKDLAALFAQTLQVESSRIGDIRVLDNYSFLEIETGLADQAIAALSGKEVKGKQISVNYARKKEGQ